MSSFAQSIAALSLVQAILVALPRMRPLPAGLGRFRSPWWGLVPAGSIVVVIAAIEMSTVSADALAYLALIAVPPLAAIALAALLPGSRPWWAIAVVPLFVVALDSQQELRGETAALALSALACVSIGWLLVSVVPARWLIWGIFAMAAVDAVLVGAEILQGPSAALVAADASGMPRLQAVEFGTARMGFGDIFVAATAGCLLASAADLTADGRAGRVNVDVVARRRQLLAAALVAVLGWGFDLLFFAFDTLPATVPVAVALALTLRLSPLEGPRPASAAAGAPLVGVTDQGDAVDRDEAGDS